MITVQTAKQSRNLAGENNGYIVTTIEGVVCFVPSDPGNADYQTMQKWLEDGHTLTAD